MAYKVYYGKLTNDINGALVAGYIWSDRTLIYDSASPSEDDYLIDPVLTREVNEAGSFEADIPHSHSIWNSLELIKGIIEIERDGEFIWQGRIKTFEIDFNLNKHIYCEGELSYLNDAYVKVDWSLIKQEIQDEDENPTGSYGYNWVKFFNDYCIGVLNGEKTFFPEHYQDPSWTPQEEIKETFGLIISLSYTTNATVSDDVVYSSGWDAFKNTLIDGMLSSIKDNIYFVVKHEKVPVGSSGEYEVRKIYPCIYFDQGDGETPEDNTLFGRGLLKQTQQTIEYGKNLLDIRISRGVNDGLATSCTAYGYETKGWWIFKNTNEISNTVMDDDLISKYGIFEKYASVDGVSSTYNSLSNVAKTMLSLDKNVEYEEVEISAVDLFDVGEASDRLDFMKITRIISEPHGIDSYLVCTKLVEPLDDPAGKQFTYGRKHSTISSSQSSIGTISQRGFDMSKATKNYIADS